MRQLDAELDDETIAMLLGQARRYRVLASQASEGALAIELENLANLFEAEASRGSVHPMTLH